MLKIDIDIRDFERFLLKLGSGISKEISASITSSSSHAQVVEHGSTMGERPWPRPGPRTVGRNGRVYSSQAPGGFVHPHGAEFEKILRDSAVKNAPWFKENVLAACDEAVAKAAELIKESVPVDTGELKSSIKAEKAK